MRKCQVAALGVIQLPNYGASHGGASRLVGQPRGKEIFPEPTRIDPGVRVYFGHELVPFAAGDEPFVELERLDGVGGDVVLLEMVEHNHVAKRPVLKRY